jgi:hypothetical protein
VALGIERKSLGLLERMRTAPSPNSAYCALQCKKARNPTLTADHLLLALVACVDEFLQKY